MTCLSWEKEKTPQHVLQTILKIVHVKRYISENAKVLHKKHLQSF